MPSVPELLVILAIVVLLFGAKKIPDLAKGLGTGIKNFKKAVKDDDEAASTAQNPQNPQNLQASQPQNIQNIAAQNPQNPPQNAANPSPQETAAKS